MKRVLIADDHAILREGLKRMLQDNSDIGKIGEVSNSREVLRELRKNDYDILLLDISMPGRSGLDIIKEVKDMHPDLAILVLSSYPEEQYALRVLRAGASGYLAKESAPKELEKALDAISRARKYISPLIAEMLACDPDFYKLDSPHDRLSGREYEVMTLISSGKTVSQVAEVLCLSVKTVSTNRSRILKKMCMKTNAEITHYAIKNRLV